MTDLASWAASARLGLNMTSAYWRSTTAPVPGSSVMVGKCACFHAMMPPFMCWVIGTPASMHFATAMADRLPEPQCSTTGRPSAGSARGSKRGEREQQRAVDPLGDVFLRLAHVDQHDRMVVQGVVHFGRRQFMQKRFRVHHRLLFKKNRSVQSKDALIWVNAQCRGTSQDSVRVHRCFLLGARAGAFCLCWRAGGSHMEAGLQKISNSVSSTRRAGGLAMEYQMVWPSRRARTKPSRRSSDRCCDTVESRSPRKAARSPTDRSPSVNWQRISSRWRLPSERSSSLACSAAAAMWSGSIFIAVLSYLHIYDNTNI